MGTNYHVKLNECECCGKCDEEIHLGKKSGGWVFLFRLQPKFYNTFDEFIKYIIQDHIIIYDEYDVVQDKDEFIKMIKDSYADKKNQRHQKFDRMSVGGIRTGNKNIGGYDFCDREFS